MHREFQKPRKIELYAEAFERLPLDETVVLYESFGGAKTACNPLAICRYLLNTRKELRHVWAIGKNSPIHPALRDNPRVTFVSADSDGYRRLLATAGTLVNNTSFARTFVRREGQRYINTWHGAPWKMLGSDVPGDPYSFDNIARNMLQATDLVFPDEHTAHVMLESQDVSDICDARIHILGQPRVDYTMTLSEKDKRHIRTELGVKPGDRIVLYAPTWRGTTGMVETEVAQFVSAVRKMALVPGVHIAVRVHHFVSVELEGQDLPANITIVPDTIDTNEMLAVSDVLVSDYSSVIFDFAPLNRPILKYIFDYDDYERRRGLYFKSTEVPGMDCHSEKDLVEALSLVASSVDWGSLPTADIWAREDGKSTERVVDAVFQTQVEPQTASEERSLNRILISMVSFNPNGITRSLRNLLLSVPDLASKARLLIPNAALSNLSNRSVAEELHQHLKFTITSQRMVGTRRENNSWRQLRVFRNKPSQASMQQLKSLMQRERRKHLSNVRFFTAIDFDGYGFYQTALVALGFPPSTRTTYVLHFEFEREREMKYPWLTSTGHLLQEFDALPTVSDSVMRVNQTDLRDAYGVPAERHFAMPNTISPNEIRQLGNEPLDSDVEQWMNQAGTHIVVVGRLSVEKNHADFLNGLAISIKNLPEPVYALFLGDGPLMNDLRRLARKLGLKDNVHFAGHRSNPYPAIRRASALVVSSTHEGQSLVLLEALTLGTPVVSTNIPGPASVLNGGQFGLLVDVSPEGMAEAIENIVHEKVKPAALFDPEEYARRAVESARQMIGR